ncbi:MAG TPA: glycoside hydrolase family 38 C-terminal domain-containing protein, partial [bacterium]|nr:glycoside hydrolase family 38 C-terminal domain-containing protein [bacterium]
LGGLWVEPDCNLTGGESLVRQVIQGTRFWREEFGTSSPIAWLPDAFGFNGALPQILKGAGIDYFFTVKLYWNVASRFPHTLFWWEGIDGTRVLAHVPYLKGGYSGFPGAADLRRARSECRHAEVYPATLFPMGHGDGGGGVTPEMLETARRFRDFPGLPRVRFVRAADFFKAAERRGAGLPVWRGELYYETHQGCYTSQAFIKRSNRRLEEALVELETLRGLKALLSGRRPGSGLDEIWREVLTYQFHDILPGTSVPEAYAEIEPRCRKLLAGLKRSLDSELGQLAPAAGRKSRRGRPAFLVFNTLNWPRREVVELEPGRPVELALPAGGYLVTAGSGLKSGRPEDRPRVSPTRLENRFFRMELDRQGRLARLYDKVNRREVLAEGAAGNDFRIFREAPVHYEAWDIDADYEVTGRSFGRLVRRRVLEAGPVRAAVRQEFSDGRSRLVQDIIIYAGLPRIDFRTEVDWQERRRMIKAAFPLSLKAGEAWYEIPFGAIARPAVPAGPEGAFRREVSGHHWADVSEAGYGVALLNDSKYGYDFDGQTLRLTLLRAPMYPNPDADRGRHLFTYALYPHAGRWPEAGVVEQGFSLNRPPLVRSLAESAPESGPPVSLFRTEGVPVVVSAFKAAEDGRGFVIRLYEPGGQSGRAKLFLPAAPVAAWETNLLEEERRPFQVDRETVEFEVRPFEIKTFYFSFSKEPGEPDGRKKS